MQANLTRGPRRSPPSNRQDDPSGDLVIERPVSIREKVYRHVRERILDGRIPAGSRLVEGRLARDIRVSRTPIREALHLLEMEGLLESIPRVGYRVRQIVWSEVEEICAIRVVNETLAAQWAVERMEPGDLAALEENLSRAEADVKAGQPESFVDYDAEFHDIIARASGSPRLWELCSTLRRHMLLYRRESIYSTENALRAIVGHRQILDKMRNLDREGVAAAVREHIEQSKRDIRRYAFEKKRS